jgi:tetratricopeptide (TPR) repeat protein
MNAPTFRLCSIICLPLALLSIATVALVAQGPGSQDPLLRQGQQKDLAGQYADARKDFATALETSSTPRAKGAALRSMAMSYAFEGNCKEATKYESQLYEMYIADQDFFNAGEIADELARVCIDAGDLDAASTWYRTGHDAGLREANITPARTDLWNFRWEHAQARIAARRGDKAGAQSHVAAAKAILDKGTNPDQAQFFPYLTGYVALYSGNYAEALADLQQANQNDPFIQCLIAQTYEHLGDQAKATEFYRKALTASNAHNPPNAYARPFAKRKLGMP